MEALRRSLISCRRQAAQDFGRFLGFLEGFRASFGASEERFPPREPYAYKTKEIASFPQRYLEMYPK